MTRLASLSAVTGRASRGVEMTWIGIWASITGVHPQNRAVLGQDPYTRRICAGAPVPGPAHLEPQDQPRQGLDLKPVRLGSLE